ncbi:MAG: PAS domain S-box protein [Verrucomicrobiae bacterium]|nr:PAS domain S-box protein [Verrucomicrobiae bacterium]
MAMDLILNLSLLVALTVVSTFFGRRFNPRGSTGAVIQGLLFATAAIIGMIRPMELEKGVFFDGRSMMLSLCALFFGPWAALVSVIPTALYRAGLGGNGVYMGVLTVITSAAIGLAFHYRWRQQPHAPRASQLLLFGVVVHVVMLCLTITLPVSVRWKTLEKMALPILVAYPLLTVLAGKVLADQEDLGRLLAELRQTNQRLDITLRSIADGVMVTDLQGRIVSLNPTAEQLTGWPQQEAVGRPIEEIFPIFNEHTAQPVENPVRRVLQEGKVVGLANHTVLRHRQGREYPIADSAAPIKDDQGRCRGVVLVFRDQTREREAHNALIESEFRYRTLIESAPALVWHCDAQGTFDYFNQRWLAFRGRSLQEEQGEGWKAGVHPDDLAGCDAAFQEALQQHRPCQFVYRLQRHDGHYRWLQEEAVPVFDRQGAFQGYIGFCLDITGQRELMARERLLLSALEASAACIFLADAAGGIEWVNPAFAAHLGVSRESVDGKNWEDYFLPPAEEQAESLENILQLLLLGQTWRGELRARRAGGEMFVAEVTLSPVLDALGSTVKVVGIFEDLTARKAVEEELRQTQKMEIIGMIAHGVAHDFNNILTSIMMSANMLQEDAALPAHLREDVDQIAGSAQVGARITSQLLSLARRDILTMEDLELNEVVRQVSRLLTRRLNDQIVIVTHLCPEGAWLKGDRTLLEQILLNLAFNARDAMPKGGTLLIETAVVETAEALTLAPNLPKHGPFVRLTVQDTGCGINPEILPRIFDPFFTTKERGKGTGIGLTVVANALRELHGGIHVQSTPAQGSTFQIYFPATRSLAGASPAVGVTPLRGGQETILLVEDEAPVRELAAKGLRKYGYNVLMAKHGREALEVFAQHQQAIQLLITDIIMPGDLRGDELARRLLAQNPALKVIYISGYPGESPVDKPDFFAQKTFLAKPFTPRQLAQTVRQTLDSSASPAPGA